MNVNNLSAEIADALETAMDELPSPFTSADVRGAIADAIAEAVIAHIQANAETTIDGESIE